VRRTYRRVRRHSAIETVRFRRAEGKDLSCLLLRDAGALHSGESLRIRPAFTARPHHKGE
jgi:hypothetical protein